MKFESAEKTNADGYSRIVVGVDYSPCSRSAVKEAVRVARLNGAEVHVIHIIYDEAIAELKRVTGVKTEALVEGRTIRLERFVAESLGTESLESCIHCEVAVGHPFNEVIKAVARLEADLLVLGAHGLSFERRNSTGKLATRCVRKAPCKVMLVRQAQDEAFRVIVAAVDFSQTSRLALHEAARIARQEGAQLHILHVYSPPWKHFMEEGLSHDLVVPGDRAEEYLREVHKELADFEYDNLEDCDGLSVRAEAFEAVSVEWGITDYLGMVKADLVVIGTRGRSPLKTLLMGSIAEHVVCESKCAVLTVKPEGFVYRV